MGFRAIRVLSIETKFNDIGVARVCVGVWVDGLVGWLGGWLVGWWVGGLVGWWAGGLLGWVGWGGVGSGWGRGGLGGLGWVGGSLSVCFFVHVCLCVRTHVCALGKARMLHSHRVEDFLGYTYTQLDAEADRWMDRWVDR